MRRLLLILVLFCVDFAGYAQPGTPNDGENPFDTPISGVEWLLLAGGILGFRKVYQKFKSGKD